jgi:hypothetical protein
MESTVTISKGDYVKASDGCVGIVHRINRKTINVRVFTTHGAFHRNYPHDEISAYSMEEMTREQLLAAISELDIA